MIYIHTCIPLYTSPYSRVRTKVLVLTSLVLLLFLFLFQFCFMPCRSLVSHFTHKTELFCVYNCTPRPVFVLLELKLEPMLNGVLILDYSLAYSVITRCWN